jgi:hypothetical protein
MYDITRQHQPLVCHPLCKFEDRITELATCIQPSSVKYYIIQCAIIHTQGVVSRHLSSLSAWIHGCLSCWHAVATRGPYKGNISLFVSATWCC